MQAAEQFIDYQRHQEFLTWIESNELWTQFLYKLMVSLARTGSERHGILVQNQFSITRAFLDFFYWRWPLTVNSDSFTKKMELTNFNLCIKTETLQPKIYQNVFFIYIEFSFQQAFILRRAKIVIPTTANLTINTNSFCL